MDYRRPPTRDPQEWLELAPPFSRGLCGQLRDWILAWEPDLTESIKWNCLCFSARKLVCCLDACQRHAGLNFFRGAELHDPSGLLTGTGVAMRSLKLKTLEGLSREALRRLLHTAVAVEDEPPTPRGPNPNRRELPVPQELRTALAKNRAARHFFTQLAPTYQREYLAWLTTAKRAETQQTRLEQTVAALAAGKKWAQRREA